MLIMNLSNVYANGDIPVSTSLPDADFVNASPVYNSQYHLAVNKDGIDYFSYTEGTTTYLVLLNSSDATQFDIYMYPFNGAVRMLTASNRSNSHYYYRNSSGGISEDVPYIGTYSSIDNAVLYVLTNGVTYPEPAPVLQSYFQLQNGYVAVFDLGSSTTYDIGLKGYSEELSTWLGNTFERTNQTYWFSDSLPTVNDSMPATPNTKIDWEEDEPKNIFGQTHYMQAQLSGTSSGRYLYIYNPAVHLKVSGSGRNETQVKNSPLDVTFNPDITVYVYDTQGSLSLLNGGGLVGNITGTYGVATSDATGGAITFTNPDTEQQYIQTSGGSTDTSSIDNKSVQGFLQELQDTLDYFVETIISLVSAPISHIKQLISTGGEFMNTLGGLFTWLPDPVMSVIVSALIVMVVIGVFKMFL